MKTQPWQEEFKKRFINLVTIVILRDTKPKSLHKLVEVEKDVIDFISTLISKERADERAKTIKECAEIAREIRLRPYQESTLSLEEKACDEMQRMGYNIAAIDIRQAIENLK